MIPTGEIEQIADELMFFMVENPEVTFALVTAITAIIYRKNKGQWPALFHLRKFLIPLVHKYLFAPEGEEAARRITEREFAGTYDMPPSKINEEFRKHEYIFPDNVAKIKWRYYNREKQYEASSWAFRKSTGSLVQVPDLMAQKQIHLMVFDNKDGTSDIYAHYEYNPFSAPVKHWRGRLYDAPRGVNMARNKLDEILGSRINN